MDKEIVVCGNIEIEKRKFRRDKNQTLSEDVDIDNIRYLVCFLLVKKKYKYFIGYKNNDYRLTHNPSKKEKRAHM